MEQLKKIKIIICQNAKNAKNAKDINDSFVYFEREKSWRCGNGFIPVTANCYKHPITGKNLGYRVIKNPITGRKKRIRIALSYQEYVKARAKTVKATANKFVRRTQLQDKYLKDVELLKSKSHQALKQKQIIKNPWLKNTINFEDRIVNQNFETLGIFNNQGKLIAKIDGTSNVVHIPETKIKFLKDNIVTHNHPDGLNYPKSNIKFRGNSFSNEDIMLAVSGDIKTFRVVSPYYRHIIERPAKGWGLMSNALNFLDESEQETQRYFNKIIQNKVKIKGKDHQDVLDLLDFANHQHHHVKMKSFAKKIGAIYKRIPLNRIL